MYIILKLIIFYGIEMYISSDQQRNMLTLFFQSPFYICHNQIICFQFLWTHIPNFSFFRIEACYHNQKKNCIQSKKQYRLLSQLEKSTIFTVVRRVQAFQYILLYTAYLCHFILSPFPRQRFTVPGLISSAKVQWFPSVIRILSPGYQHWL